MVFNENKIMMGASRELSGECDSEIAPKIDRHL